MPDIESKLTIVMRLRRLHLAGSPRGFRPSSVRSARASCESRLPKALTASSSGGSPLLRSEIQSSTQRKPASGIGGVDQSEVRRIDVEIRVAEHRTIQHVHHVRTQFELTSFVDPDALVKIHVELEARRAL